MVKNDGKPAKNRKKNAKVKVFQGRKKSSRDGTALITQLQQKYETIDSASIGNFADLPLSPQTLKGLRECQYKTPTEIQRETIRLSLTGKDILGAAQTGSGKTLAFLIPILEKLYCLQWSRLDGVAAIVITPTRELAYQIFEELRRVGVHHDFSAGLIIGGKDLKFERKRMDQCNIIICTPGRLLQHMDENPLFDCVNMQILVLDEADRCLDLGFEPQMNAIIANLPTKRQTLLFSATQTKSVRDLARLSLKDPSYVSVYENNEYGTPKTLQQSYTVCELKDKISILYSFIRNHLKSKIIIFLCSCKQVKYVYEMFCKLRPGTSLLALYGTLHQLKRMEIYENFCGKKQAVLFATDVAARGLDFPEVDWVVQADCPEDVATYIHRVGRTARYNRGGESLLLLLPSEIQMLDNLQERKIPVEKIDINPIKLANPVRKMEAFLARDSTLRDTAQRAFVSYAKSIHLMKDKAVFDVNKLDTDSYANSLGLAIPPRIRFLQRLNKTTKPVQKVQQNTHITFTDETPAETSQFHVPDDSDDEDIGFKVIRKDHNVELPTDFEIEENQKPTKAKKPVTKAALVKKMLKKRIVPNKKIIFDEQGDVVGHSKSQLAIDYENEDEGGINIEKARSVLKEEDKIDKQLFKEKVKAKHKEEKRKLKAQKLKEKEEEQEQDDFGESDEDDEPDLSWLPDPDKIYGAKDNDSDPEQTLKVTKRKVKEPTTKGVKKRKLDRIAEKLDVNEAEELAMMLLQSKTK